MVAFTNRRKHPVTGKHQRRREGRRKALITRALNLAKPYSGKFGYVYVTRGRPVKRPQCWKRKKCTKGNDKGYLPDIQTGARGGKYYKTCQGDKRYKVYCSNTKRPY